MVFSVEIVKFQNFLRETFFRNRLQVLKNREFSPDFPLSLRDGSVTMAILNLPLLPKGRCHLLRK